MFSFIQGIILRSSVVCIQFCPMDILSQPGLQLYAFSSVQWTILSEPGLQLYAFSSVQWIIPTEPTRDRS